jgi:hypothetical protein
MDRQGREFAQSLHDRLALVAVAQGNLLLRWAERIVRVVGRHDVLIPISIRASAPYGAQSVQRFRNQPDSIRKSRPAGYSLSVIRIKPSPVTTSPFAVMVT